MKTQKKRSRYVNLRCFFLYLCIFTFIYIGCGGGGGGGSNDDSDLGAELNAIVISPKAAMLTKSGQTEQFIYTAYNNDGDEISVSLEWYSTNPDAVSVDDNGMVTTLADIGSALITASSGGVVSNEVMIVIAEPVQGAIMVSDDQVISDVEPEDPNAEWGLGLRLIVRLTGIAPPAVNTILLGTGEKPVGGKVVSAVQDGDEVVVVLEIVTIPEMFANILIDEKVDLSSQVPTLAEIFAENYDVTWNQDGSLEFTLKQPAIAASASSPRVGVPMGTSVLNPGANYGPFKCEFGVANPLVLDSFPSSLTITNNLWVDFLYDSNQGGLQRCLLKGDVTGIFKVSNTISTALQSSVSCSTTLVSLSYPFPGGLGVIWTHVPLGLGFEIDGKITVAQFGFELQLDGRASVEAGVQCPGGGLGMNCDLIGDLDVDNNADFRWITPDLMSPLEVLAQIRVEPALSAFAFANLEIGLPPPFNRIFNAEVAKAKFGVKQAGNFAIVEGQMDDQGYSSDYLLSLDASFGVGATIQNFMNFMQINVLQTEVKFTDPLAESPKVLSAVADTLAFTQGDNVKFTIDLNPQNINYPIIGYNVSKVIIYRKTDDGSGGIGPAELLVENVPTQGQTQIVLDWTADAQGTIEGDYFAFVETHALPFSYFGQLEVAEVQPPPPQVNTEVKIGTVSGYLRAYYYDFNSWPDDYSMPEIGIPLDSTESCEYNGGQSTLGGTSIVLSDDVSYENQSAVGSISASESGNSLNVSFSAFAVSAPGMAPTNMVRGRGEVRLGTDTEQIVLIVENLTNGQVDLHLDWAITKILKISGNGSCEAYVAYDLDIGETNNSYYSEEHCNGNINSSGQPSGSKVISIDPGKHCLYLSVGVEAVAEVTWENYNTPTSSEASISGVVNVSVQ